MNEQLAGERSSLAQVLRQEFADRLAASEEENRQVKAELAELRARQRLELEQLTQEKQAELEEVHGRWAAGLIGPLGRPEPASGPDAGPRRELAECPPSSFFLSADAEPGPFAVGSMFEDQLFPSLVLGPGPRKKPSHPEPGLVLPCGCREAPWAWVAHVLCRKMEAPEVNSEQPIPRGPLSLSQVPACLPLAGALRGRCTVGSRPPLSGPLPEGCGFTWGQLWGHRSCHQLLQAAQGPRSAGLGQGGQDSSPAAFRGDGGSPTRFPATHRVAGWPCAPLQGEDGPGKEGGGCEQPSETARGGSPWGQPAWGAGAARA